MIKWTQDDGRVFTFDNWKQVIEEIKTWPEVEFEGEEE